MAKESKGFKARITDAIIEGILRATGFEKRFKMQREQMHAVSDSLSGIDPDASPNMADFVAPDIEARPAITISLRNFEPPSWRSIVPVIRQGRKFGIEYLALTPPAARTRILDSLRTDLPYAVVRDEGETQSVEDEEVEGASERIETKFGDRWIVPVWSIGIVLGEPGYGIRDEEIDDNTEEWLACARDFRRCAGELLQTVLSTYDISLDTLPHIGAMGSVPDGATHGHGIMGDTMNDEWRIQFHSGALFLTHLETGQQVRVSMYHGAVGGVLHGYGLSRWVKTTPRWNHLAAFLHDDYFDARRVIARLYEKGCWEEVPRNRDLLLIGTKALAAKMN